MRSGLGLAIGLSLLCVAPAPAADGRIPVWGQTTITEPGAYVLTRNIVLGGEVGGSVIVIDSADVDLDLNGFWIRSNTETSDPPIRILQFADNVRIRNGSIRGNREDPPAIVAEGVYGLVLEKLNIDSGGGVRFSATVFKFQDLVLLVGFGHAFEGSGGQGTIRDCEIHHIGGWAGGIVISGSDILVQNNRLFSVDTGVAISGQSISLIGNSLQAWPRGIDVTSCAGCRIVDNTVHNADMCLTFAGNGSVVNGNVCVESSAGITINGSDNTVVGNRILGNGSGTGISFAGDRNVYSRNVASGNLQELSDTGTGNVSLGDNVLGAIQ